METTNQQTEIAKRLGDYSLLHALTDRRYPPNEGVETVSLAPTSEVDPINWTGLGQC